MQTVMLQSRDEDNTRMLSLLMRLSFLGRVRRLFHFIQAERLLPFAHLARTDAWLDTVGGLALAHQAVHLVDAFAIPRELRPSPVATNFEAHWRIPGAPGQDE